ncbi:MAG: PEGA domain-containing protein [Phycisphaerales bacterium]|nr:PEGA domain-containing protein [Phycisphaerales bacterium]
MFTNAISIMPTAAGLILLCSLGLFTGCATIVNGKTQDISVSTVPPGATVMIDGQQTLITPSKVALRRNKDYVFTISKDGYQTQVVPVTGVLSGWLLGNLVFGGLIGGGVDAATGAGFTLTPESIAIVLQPLQPGQTQLAAPTGPLSTDERAQLADKMKADGIIDEKQHAAIKKKLEEERKNSTAPNPN